MFNIQLRKTIKKNLTGIKNLTKQFHDLETLHKTFEFVFEKISNRDDDKYKQLFNVDKIFNSRTMKQWRYAFDVENLIVVEFVKYKEAPQELLIIFNGFSRQQQLIIDFYILKGDK